MIKKLHKIPDRVFFRSIILILILWNLKYFIMPVQVLYTALTQDIFQKNIYYSPVYALREEIKKHPDFFDDGQIGFVSELQGVNIFLTEDTTKAFFTAQYAVVPSIMKNNTDAKYIIGTFSKKENIPNNFVVIKELPEKMYLLEKVENNG